MVKNKDKWSALSMKERADLIKLYVSNGITSLNDIKKDYNSFGPGGHIETDEYGYPADITPAIVTQDAEFNKFLMTLPDNQRLTSEEDYHTYQYWKINGRPKDFSEALNLGMYHYDSSDNSYHANSVAFDSKGVGHFMKPKHHSTVKYELDWYNKGIGTLEGGKQYPLQGEERKEWEDFRSQYQLDSTGVDYKYVPRNHYNSFGDGGYKDENAKKKPKYVDHTITTDPTEYNESIIAAIPTSHLSNRKVRLLAKDHARADDDLTYDIKNRFVTVGSTKKHEKVYNKAFNRELRKIADEKKEKEIQERLLARDSYSWLQGPMFDRYTPPSKLANQVGAIIGATTAPIAGSYALPVVTEAVANISPHLIKGGLHALKVATNPATAKTIFGAAAATAADAVGTAYGIQEVSNTADRWLNGDFHHSDIPQVIMDGVGIIPFANTATNAIDNAYDIATSLYKNNRVIKQASKPMSYGDPGLAQDYINAPSNAEGIQIDPRATAIYKKQITGQLSSKNPSKLTEAELQGLSRHDRTNIRERIGKDLGKAARTIEGSKPYVIDDAKFLEFMKQNYAQSSPGKHYDYVKISTHTENPVINDIKTFIDQLPDIEINPIFKTVKDPDGYEWETPILTKYRHTLSTEEGLPGDDLSTKDIQKLLTFYEDHLNTHVTGKLKRIPMWHSSPKSFDRFDLSHLGEHTGNTGAYGPGNYFNGNIEYGFNTHFSQPFYITDIDQLMLGQDASDYKHLISPRSATVDKVFYPKNGRFATVSIDRLNDDLLTTYPIYKGEVAVPRNTGIKSLYPHSSRFVRQPDGTVTFTPTDWNDIRFNFKDGGKLLTKRK